MLALVTLLLLWRMVQVVLKVILLLPFQKTLPSVPLKKNKPTYNPVRFALVLFFTAELLTVIIRFACVVLSVCRLVIAVA